MSVSKSGMHTLRAPKHVISGPCNRLKITRNFSRVTVILWMNLNFIKLLTILQLITIWNSSGGNNRKLQATKKLVKSILFSVFHTSLHFRKFRSSFCLWLSSALKIIHCSPWPKKVVHLWSKSHITALSFCLSISMYLTRYSSSVRTISTRQHKDTNTDTRQLLINHNYEINSSQQPK